jgi:excisionase family DNA binding protein
MPATINLDLVKSADARLKRAKRLNPNVTARPVPIEELVQRGALTVPELAAIANMHPLTIRRAIGAGELKAASNGAKGHYRITRGDANAWWKGRGGSVLFADVEAGAITKPTRTKAEARRQGRGFLKGRVASSDAFLAARHAEAEAEAKADATRLESRKTTGRAKGAI